MSSETDDAIAGLKERIDLCRGLHAQAIMVDVEILEAAAQALQSARAKGVREGMETAAKIAHDHVNTWRGLGQRERDAKRIMDAIRAGERVSKKDWDGAMQRVRPYLGWQSIGTAPRDRRVLVTCMSPEPGFEKLRGWTAVDQWDDELRAFGQFNETYYPATHWCDVPTLPAQPQGQSHE